MLLSQIPSRSYADIGGGSHSNSGESGDSSAGTANSGNSSDNSSNSNSNESHTNEGELSSVLISSAVVYGGSAVALWFAVSSTIDATDNPGQAEATEELARYLRQNHGSVSRDVLLAQGVFWNQWQIETGLSSEEMATFRYYFDGSSQQTKMLQALNSDLSLEQAQAFALELTSAMRDALGQKRFTDLVQVAFSRKKRHASAG